MFELPDLSIRIEAPSSETLSDLVAVSGDADPASTPDDLVGPNAEFIVARLDGRPVGCIVLLDHVKYGEARRLFVVEDMRGKGIAAALVVALEAAARDIGLQRVGLNSGGIRQSGQRAFARQGFHSIASDGSAWLEKRL